MSAELELIARLKNEAKAGLAQLKGDIKDVGTEVAKSDKATKLLSNSLKVGLAAGAAAGAAGLALLVKTTTKSIELAGIQQDAEAALAQTIESTGMAAGLTADELKGMASGLQEVTTFGDETILRGQSLLLTFTAIGSEVFPRATETALDMAQVFGSVDSAAVQLGKALNDPIKGVSALQRVGVSFTESQKDQIRVLQESGDLMGAQTIILDELAKEFGGQARSAAETFTGRMTQLNNVVGDGYEIIGLALIPALTGLAEDALPVATEAVNTMAASLDTQLIPLASESVSLLLEMVDTAGSFGELSDETLTFEEAARKTRVTVQLFEAALQFVKLGSKGATQSISGLKHNIGLLASSTDDLTRRTDLMGYALKNAANDAMVAATIRAEGLTAAYGGQKTALDELEITSNLYIDALSSEIVGTEAAEESSGRLGETYVETRAASEALGGETGILAEVMNQAAEAAAVLEGKTADYFSAAAPAIENTASWSDELYTAAEAAGASAEELAILGTGLGLFTTEAAEAALQSAAIRVKIDELAQAYIDGEISVSGMRGSLQSFIQQLTGELPNSVQGGIDVIDALKGKAEEASGNYSIHFDITTTGEIPQPAGGGTTGSGTGNIAPDDGYALGGYTGDRPGIAGFVHGREFVFDEASTKNIGVPQLEMMQQAARSGNSHQAGGDFYFSPSITVHIQGGSGGGVDAGALRKFIRGELTLVARDAETRWRMRR